MSLKEQMLVFVAMLGTAVMPTAIMAENEIVADEVVVTAEEISN